MGVRVERRADLSVPKPLLHDRRRYARSQQERRTRVTQAVKLNPSNVGRCNQTGKFPLAPSGKSLI